MNLTPHAQMRLSVLVAVYNKERFLKPFLESLAVQCAPDVEFVLVDDCSTDGSLALMRELAQTLQMTNVRIVALPKNVGVSEARQVALDAAQGDYVIYADPDDTVDPGMYQSLLAVAEREDADFVWEDFYEDGQRKDCAVKGDWTGENLICAILAWGLHGNVWSRLIRRDFIRRCGARFLKGRVGYCEDDDFICTVLAANPKCVYASGCHYRYRVVPGSATHSDDLQGNLASLKRVIEHLETVVKTPRTRMCLRVYKFAVYLSAQKGGYRFVCLWTRRAFKAFTWLFCRVWPAPARAA